MPPAASPLPGSPDSESVHPLPDSDPAAFQSARAEAEPFELTPRLPAPVPGKLSFGPESLRPDGWSDRKIWGEAAAALFQPASLPPAGDCSPGSSATSGLNPAAETALVEAEQAAANLNRLGSLRPLGQLRESFILATGDDGLWIIDQHVAHERILFEKICKLRLAESPEKQQLLMPLIVELTPGQMSVFAEICDELNCNGFEVEPFGSRTFAVKTTAAGVTAGDVEHMLHEILDQFERDEQVLNLERIRTGIAASIACHAAIKVNMPLEQNKMEWLLSELAKTDCPMSCPHGRPVVLRYSVKDIQRAFKRI
jgi:DNA mismatch repair protein MutL